MIYGIILNVCRLNFELFIYPPTINARTVLSPDGIKARAVKIVMKLIAVDIQKAYDTVQHHLLWDRLESIGVGPRMLAAIKSLYSSGTLSMKVAGRAGQPRLQRMGVRQGCPLSPTLFGLFFDGLHDRLHSRVLQRQAFSSDLAIGSRPWWTPMMLFCCHGRHQGCSCCWTA